MRICFLSDPRYLHTQRWARYFIERGHNVIIVGGPEEAQGEVPGIRTRPLGEARFRGPWLVRTLRALNEVIAEFRPDILHMHYLGMLVAPVLLRFHPFVVSPWGADIIGETGLVREPRKDRWLKRFVLRHADAVLAFSDYLARATCQYAGLPAERVQVYSWGVDRAQFTPRHARNGDGIVIGFIKALMPKYGPEFLLQAIPAIRDRHPNLEVYLAGDGPLHAHLEALAAQLGIADIVTFAGHVNHDRVPEYLGRTDIFVMPSVYESETFGVAAVEAQAMGVPVVASRVGGVSEAVAHGVTGLLVPPRDSAALAAAILRLIEDPALRASMSREGPGFVARHYDWATNAARVEQLYRSLLDGDRRARGRG
jgi:L-malate glycosyltransferase